MGARRDEDVVLRAIYEHPNAPLVELARTVGWTYGRDNAPNKMKVKRAIDALMAAKLVVEHRGQWMLTPKGQKELNALDSHSVVTPPPPPRPL